MKIKKLHSLVTTAMIFIAGAANAFDGTINVQGAVSANTCLIKVNNGTENEIVTLPTVSTSALADTGSTAGQTPFTISLSGCTGPTLTHAKAHFESGAYVNAETGRLNIAKDAPGQAQNVSIQFLNANDELIHLGAADQNDVAVNITEGAAVMTYAARYHADAPVVPGAVSTFVNYSVVYD